MISYLFKCSGYQFWDIGATSSVGSMWAKDLLIVSMIIEIAGKKEAAFPQAKLAGELQEK